MLDCGFINFYTSKVLFLNCRSRVTIDLNKVSEVRKINLYINNLSKTEMTQGKVIFSNQDTVIYQKEFAISNSSYDIVKIDFSTIKCNRVILDLANTTQNLGISEVEILPNCDSIPFKEYQLQCDLNKKNFILGILKFIDSITFKIQKKIYRKLPNKFIQNRQKYEKGLLLSNNNSKTK